MKITWSSLLEKLLTGILILAIIGLLARFIFFKEQIDEWEKGLERMEQWKEDYREDHPNASKDEVENALKDSLDNLGQWREDYKKAHPDATEEEIDQAWNEAWEKQN